MYIIKNNTWTALPDCPCNQKYSFATVHGDEIWVKSNSNNELSAFNYKTKTHRLVDTPLPTGHSILISHASILYIIKTGNNDIYKVSGPNDECEKIFNDTATSNFNYTYSPYVFHNNMYYLVDCERNLLYFDVEKEQLFSTPQKFDK